MSALRKRFKKDGSYVWVVDFRHPITGRKIIRSTKTSDERTAKLIAKSLEVELARAHFGLGEFDRKKPIPLETFMGEYVKYSKTNKSESTAEMDETALKLLIKVTGNVTLPSISPKTIELWKAESLKTLSETSVNIYQRALKAAFNVAKKWGYISENPFISVKLVKPTGDLRPKFLSEEDIDKLFSVVKDKSFRDLLKFYLYTGCRRNEVLWLEWEDIDLEGRVIHIHNKPGFKTKTGASRVIPISDKLMEVIEGMEGERSGWVFKSPRTGGPYFEDAVGRRLKRYVKKAGLDPSLSLHNLRHTFASHLVQKGVSLYIVAKLMGHSSTRVTEIYSHLVPNELTSVVNLLDFS